MKSCVTHKTSTGFGQHADYVFGWEGNTLQTAMDSGCYLRNCSQLTSQMPEVKNKCNVPVTAVEDIDGCELHVQFERCALILTVLFYRVG
jgi:hypothetical protein